MLGYDGRGNLTSSGTSTYSYNADNLMISAPGGVTMGWDPLGRMAQIASGSATTRFGYDGVNMIAEYNAANTLTRRYVHGPGTDDPIVWCEGAGTADRRFMMADERGSIVSVTNASGAILAINSYDEYGIPGASNIGRFQYTGQVWLPEVGLYHYKARMYSPTLGRLMQTDPVGYADGLNWYSYVGNDPINFVDPLGLNADIHVKGNRLRDDYCRGQLGLGFWNILELECGDRRDFDRYGLHDHGNGDNDNPNDGGGGGDEHGPAGIAQWR